MRRPFCFLLAGVYGRREKGFDLSNWDLLLHSGDQTHRLVAWDRAWRESGLLHEIIDILRWHNKHRWLVKWVKSKIDLELSTSEENVDACKLIG